VHLPDDGVVFAGDLLFRLCTPIGWEGTFARWIAALERIEALAPDVIVPGHGPLCGVEGPKEMRAYLEQVFGESRRGFEQGLDVLEAARRMDLGPWRGWTQPERVVFNVARAYRELRGGAWDEAVDFAPLLDAACELRRHWDRG
jgi:glyoxylase-like metal-dependent hydrolase (beta-lactamase superfamily II)